MHWRKLVEASELYPRGYDKFYRDYLQSRDNSLWDNPALLTEEEARRLVHFVNQWGTRSQLVPGNLRTAYVSLFPLLADLKGSILWEFDATATASQQGTVSSAVATAFDTVARCDKRKKRYESTGASKMLHTWLPELCVMWDGAIAAGYGFYARRKGTDYSTFLIRVKHEALEALDSYISDKGGQRYDAAAALCQRAGNGPLTKLIDEYNYAKYTLSCDKLWSH